MATAVLYVKDLPRMKVFYEGFGMSTVESDGDEFCVLASNDWELSLVSVPAAVAATIVITDPPKPREDSPIKLVFEVASIDGLESTVSTMGGQVYPIEAAWVFRGYRNLDCVDPEGNVVQARQKVRDE